MPNSFISRASFVGNLTRPIVAAASAENVQVMISGWQNSDRPQPWDRSRDFENIFAEKFGGKKLAGPCKM
jgi:hypothetical protein